MKEIRIPHIKQVKISLLQNGDRPASVACCSGWAKWSQHSNLLSLSIEVTLDAGTTDRLLQHLSSGEGHFNLEIQSRADAGTTVAKLFPNCRTETIECKFGPLLPANSVGIRYRFKIRTEQAASRINGEVLGTGGDTTNVKARNPERRVSVFKTKTVAVRRWDREGTRPDDLMGECTNSGNRMKDQKIYETNLEGDN